MDNKILTSSWYQQHSYLLEEEQWTEANAWIEIYGLVSTASNSSIFHSFIFFLTNQFTN